MESIEGKDLGFGPPGPENPNQEAYASRLASREEEFAKRDPILERLTRAETPKDIAESLTVLASFEDFDKAEANDPYSLRYYIRAAFSGQQVFSKTNEQLVQEGIVVGGITPEGYLEEGGKIKKYGYTIRIEPAKEPRMVPVPKEKRHYKQDEQGNVVFDEKGNPVYGKIERWVDVIPQEVERPCFGKDAEREALARAYEAAVDMFVIRERIHTLFTIFDEHKADLDGMVKLFYQRAPHLSNLMHQKIFTMPDIGMIDKEHLENQEFGKRINLAMRLLYVVGNCETREKMEKLMKRSGYKKLSEALGQDKMLKLVGDIGRWTTKKDRNKKTVDDETKNGVRGDLTARGNVFAADFPRGVDDETKVIMVIEKVVGDPDAVRVAHRIFKLWGLADRFGVETYGKLPTAEEIIAQLEAVQSGKQTYEQWREKADSWSDLLSIPGEPVASDLGKLFWPQYWRLKDILKDRPAGPIYTYDKTERLCLSLPELVKIEIALKVPRSLDEVWWGYEDEDAKDLGEIEWLAIKPDKQIQEATEHLEDDREFLENKGRRVRYGAWGLYTLFLYLAGENDPMKRPWAFINHEEYNPQDFIKNAFFTSKIKFLGIILNAGTIPEGNYRAIQKGEGKWEQIVKEYKPKKENESIADMVENVSKQEVKRMLESIKRHYWKGVHSLPQASKLWVGMKLEIPGEFRDRPYLMDEADRLAKKFGFI